MKSCSAVINAMNTTIVTSTHPNSSLKHFVKLLPEVSLQSLFSLLMLLTVTANSLFPAVHALLHSTNHRANHKPEYSHEDSRCSRGGSLSSSTSNSSASDADCRRQFLRLRANLVSGLGIDMLDLANISVVVFGDDDIAKAVDRNGAGLADLGTRSLKMFSIAAVRVVVSAVEKEVGIVGRVDIPELTALVCNEKITGCINEPNSTNTIKAN